jgi:hypothetical protein
MIDLALPPYNCLGNTDPDTGIGMDCTSQLMDAIGAAVASNTRGGVIDYGGSAGDMIRLPKGTVKVSPEHTIVLPYGVGLEGVNDYASTLWLKPDSLNPADHFIDIGDRSTHLAQFGGKVRNMVVYCPSYETADYGTFAVYSNNCQDTAETVDGVRIFAGQRGGLGLVHGYGGSTIVRVRNVTAHTFNPNHFAAYFNFGADTMIKIDTLQTSSQRRNPYDPSSPDYKRPLAGSNGLYIGNGTYNIQHVHHEVVETGTFIHQTVPGSSVEIAWHTHGGEGCGNQIMIQGGSLDNGTIGLQHIKGSPDLPGTHTIYDGRNGKTNLDGHIYGRIVR